MNTREGSQEAAADNQVEVTDHHALTPEQYIEKIARIIAVKKLLNEQVASGQVRMYETMQVVAEVLGLGQPIQIFQPVIRFDGDDLSNVKEFYELLHQIEGHPPCAAVDAETNEKIAKAREEYTLFKAADRARSQEEEPTQQNQDRPKTPEADEDNDDFELEKMTL